MCFTNLPLDQYLTVGCRVQAQWCADVRDMDKIYKFQNPEHENNTWQPYRNLTIALAALENLPAQRDRRQGPCTAPMHMY